MKFAGNALRGMILICAVCALAACSSDADDVQADSSASKKAQSAAPDAYSSATEAPSKITLTGDDLKAAAAGLKAASSDLADLATSQKAGYAEPKSLPANVMSVNPDGSIGVSTITQWQYVTAADGTDRLILQLTYGQNAQNLAAQGRTGSLYVPGVEIGGKKANLLVHLRVAKVDELKYSDAVFNAGRFNHWYSGKAGQKSQFTLTCDIPTVENVTESVKLGIVF